MNLRKVVFTTLGIYCLGAFFQLYALEISTNHQPVIVKPEAASPAESYAAEELAEYLGKVLGCPVEIAAGAVPQGNKVPIILGRHPANADLRGELKEEEQAIVDVLPDRIRLWADTKSGPEQRKNLSMIVARYMVPMTCSKK